MFAALSHWPAGGSSAVAAFAFAWAASAWYTLRTTPRRPRPAQARQQVPLALALWHTLILKPGGVLPAVTLLPLHLMALTSAWRRRRAPMHPTTTRLGGNRTQELRPWPRVPAPRVARARSQHSSMHGYLPVMLAPTRRVRAAGGRESEVAPHRHGAYPAAASARAKAWRGRSWTRAYRRSACKLCSSMAWRRGVLQQGQPGRPVWERDTSPRPVREQDASPGAPWAQTLLPDANQPPRVAGALLAWSVGVPVLPAVGVLLTHPSRVWNVGAPALHPAGVLLVTSVTPSARVWNVGVPMLNGLPLGS